MNHLNPSRVLSRVPVPTFIKRLDRMLLLNYPKLWITRFHYVLFYGLLLVLFFAYFRFSYVYNSEDELGVSSLLLILGYIIFSSWFLIVLLPYIDVEYGFTNYKQEVIELLVYIACIGTMIIPSILWTPAELTGLILVNTTVPINNIEGLNRVEQSIVPFMVLFAFQLGFFHVGLVAAYVFPFSVKKLSNSPEGTFFWIMGSIGYVSFGGGLVLIELFLVALSLNGGVLPLLMTIFIWVYCGLNFHKLAYYDTSITSELTKKDRSMNIPIFKIGMAPVLVIYSAAGLLALIGSATQIPIFWYVLFTSLSYIPFLPFLKRKYVELASLPDNQ